MSSTVKISDYEASIETKSMWSGSIEPTENDVLVINGNYFEAKRYAFSQRVYSILEELLINCADQDVKRTITRIDIDIKDGKFRIANYGSGFDIRWHEALQSWEPYILCIFPNMGTETTKSPNSITGGVNGLGLKITVRSCTNLKLETQDVNTKQRYELITKHKGTEWFDNRKDSEIVGSTIFSRDNIPLIVNERIMEIPETEKVSHTIITILPRYDRYRMHATAIYHMFEAFKTRIIEVGLYVQCPIYVNGMPLTINTLEKFARAYCGVDNVHWYKEFMLDPLKMGNIHKRSPGERAELFARTEGLQYPLKVAIVVRNDNRGLVKWGCINGVALRTPGTSYFFTHFANQIASQYKAASGKHAVTESYVRNSISIFIVGAVPAPEWDTQSKRTFNIKKEFMEPYVLPISFGAELWNAVKGRVMEQINLRSFNELDKIARKAISGSIQMPYTPCELAKRSTPWSKRKDIYLVLSEGESADKAVKNGLGTSVSALKWNQVGTYQLRGVPINARRKFVEVTIGGVVKRRPTQELAENAVISGLIKVIGLDYDCSYETQAEYELLNYPNIILCTDEDYDGAGKIASLMLNFFDLFWPALLKRGCIYRLRTDRVRVFQGNKFIQGFSNDYEFEEWAMSRFYYNLISHDIYTLIHHPTIMGHVMVANGNKPFELDSEYEIAARAYIKQTYLANKFDIRYYKGLGGHGPQFCELMFRAENFWKNLIKFTYDDRAQYYFNSFFESDSGPRKEIMINADGNHSPTAASRIGNFTNLTCSDHLLGPMIDYSFEDLTRKLPGIYDGLNDVKLRILYAVMTELNDSELIKIDQLAGAVAKKSHYHHSVNGLYEILSKVVQNFFGSRRFPFLIGYGDFGNRNITSAAQPRYIDARRNIKAINSLFPLADLTILPYRTEDGKRTVPQYFCAIVPPIYETTMVPSQGWQICAHAMNIFDIIDKTRIAVENEDPAVFLVGEYQLDVNGWRGSIIEGVLSFGNAHLSREGQVIVNELPFMTSGSEYEKRIYSLGIDETEGSKGFKPHPFIADFGIDSIINQSNGKIFDPNEINIRFRVSPGFMQSLSNEITVNSCGRAIKLTGKHAFLYRIGLCEPITHQLNFIDERGRVQSFKNYGEIAVNWFAKRRELYIERVKREEILLHYRALMLNFIIITIQSGIAEHFKTAESDEEMNQILQDAGIWRLNTAIINEGKEAEGLTSETLSVYISGHLSFAKVLEGAAPTNLNDRINYNYITHITLGQLQKKHVSTRTREMEKINAKLAIMRQEGYWQQLWIKELDALKKVCEEHIPSMWTKESQMEI